MTTKPVKADSAVKEEAAKVAPAAKTAEPAKTAAPAAKTAPAAKAAEPAKKAPAKKAAAKKPAAAKKAAPAKKPAAAKKAPAKKSTPKTPDIAALADMLSAKVAKKNVSKINEDKIAVDIKVYGEYEEHLYILIENNTVEVKPFEYIGADVRVDMPIADFIEMSKGKYDFKGKALVGDFFATGNLTKLLKLITALF